jgi:hypothetical protein
MIFGRFIEPAAAAQTGSATGSRPAITPPAAAAGK